MDIENATIGYNQDGANQLKEDLRAQYLDSTVDALNDNFHQLEESIDSIWVGQSADNFKENMGDDVNDVTRAIKELREAIDAEIDNTMNKMAEADENLVQRRS